MHWLGFGRVKDERAADLAAFGLKVDLKDETSPDFFEVWPENEQALQVFLLMTTQWRQGAGGPTGLDYPVLFSLLAMYDITEKNRVFEEVRDMEIAVLNKISEAASVNND